ncbi:MAG TPA: hypothetical protein DHW71_04080 [Gammaproteobacteria bacterium]|nr:hypothetical protein [Gammaproteobacteria bacterium]MEC8010220.1 CFI-box-CTERM domain-containing protein [Pseudomonadota bacterium]HBF07182.1 hypothetical protein [Gammaproteobacteria bacterium]HCK92139.1 hypothetical protein [Gammaproteobacteria bacterium]
MNKNSSKKTPPVAASDVGRAAFCPHFLELKQQGHTPSKQAQYLMKQGSQAHADFNQSITRAKSKDKRCYIASYLYGIDDPRTESLRQFRDKKLLPHKAGRFFVSAYYRTSPFIITLAQKSSMINKLLNTAINGFMTKIKDLNNNKNKGDS